MEEKKIQQHEIQNLGNLELLAHQVVEGFITGLHKSPFHGFSVEFAEHRLYNTGESTKHIDWKLFGRTEKLFTKRYEEETNLRCQVIIDNSSSMHYPPYEKGSVKLNKITFSVHCAASIMYLLRKQRDATGLSLFSENIELHTPAKSSSIHHKYLLMQLEKAMNSVDHELNKTTSAATAIHRISENIHKRSLVVIFSDMMDSGTEAANKIFSALQHLRHNKHEVILFHVVDKDKEIDFHFDQRPYQFVDVETGEKIKVHANQVKQSYKEAIEKYRKELVLKCAQYRIDFVEADINKGYKQVLLPYLIKRGKMY